MNKLLPFYEFETGEYGAWARVFVGNALTLDNETEQIARRIAFLSDWCIDENEEDYPIAEVRLIDTGWMRDYLEYLGEPVFTDEKGRVYYFQPN